MASNNRRVIFNTRERLLSTDLNDATALFHAKSTDEAAAGLSGDFWRNSGSSGSMSGIVSGGFVSTNGVDLNAEVSAILGFKFGTAATALDSPYLKIEKTSPTTIDLSSFVDPGNPRWVAIEVAPGDTVEVASTRDIFQPALGTFSPVSVDKIRAPEPVFTVNAGAPSPTPALPTGTAGTIPLAYVYITAAAVVLSTTDVVRCRPLLGNPESSYEIGGKGGVNVTGGGGGTDVRLNPLAVYFPRARFEAFLAGTPVVDANIATNPNFAQGESYPAGDAPIYFYLASAPYPSGYDADVAITTREFFDNTVAGTPRFPSNPAVTPGAVINGIVVASTAAPTVTGINAPSRVGSYPGTLRLNDPAWSNGEAAHSIYLGSAMALSSVAPAGLTTQQTHGGRVRITEGAKIPRSFDNQSNADSGVQTSQLRELDVLGTGAIFPSAGPVLPEAREYDLTIQLNYIGVAAASTVSAYVDSPTYDTPGPAGFYLWQSQSDTAGGDARLVESTTIRTDDAGNFEWRNQNTAAAGTVQLLVSVRGYLDPILSER